MYTYLDIYIKTLLDRYSTVGYYITIYMYYDKNERHNIIKF